MIKHVNYPIWSILGSIEQKSSISLQDQLFLQLRRLIVNGQISRGVRLPASRSMAQEMGISRNTVTLVYDRLQAEGYVRRETGSGTFVEDRLPEDLLPSSPNKGNVSVRSEQMLSRRGLAISSRRADWTRLDRFDLSPGLPALDIFPYKQFGSIAANYWRRFAVSDLGYGEGGSLSALQHQIATYLVEARGIRCEPEQILVVGSTLQAATLVSNVLLDVGDLAVVEDPAYAMLLNSFRATGLRLEPLAVSQNGIDVDRLHQKAPGARLAIVSPVGQFPSGVTMTEQAKSSLLDWASANDAWIFEDDFNSELRWRGTPSQPLAAMDKFARVIHVSSFNRILAPGLRLAYMVVPEALIEPFAAAQESLSCYAPLTHQHLVADFMAGGDLASHIRRTRALYKERSDVMISLLRSTLSDTFAVPDITVGLHLTLASLFPIDDVDLAFQLRKVWIDTPAVSSYCIKRNDITGLIVGFGNMPPERIEPAIKRMAQVTKRVLSNKEST